MEDLKLWAFSLSGALVVTSVFRILINKSSLYKSINIFLSVFVFLYTIIPLERVFNNFEFTTQFENREESYNEYYRNGYESIIKNAINNICEENNVSVISVNIDSYIDENGYLCVRNIEVEIDSPKKKDEIKNIIYDKTGFEVSVIE